MVCCLVPKKSSKKMKHFFFFFVHLSPQACSNHSVHCKHIQLGEYVVNQWSKHKTPHILPKTMRASHNLCPKCHQLVGWWWIYPAIIRQTAEDTALGCLGVLMSMFHLHRFQGRGWKQPSELVYWNIFPLRASRRRGRRRSLLRLFHAIQVSDSIQYCHIDRTKNW